MSERKGFKPMLAALMGMAGLDPMRMPSSAGYMPKRGGKRNKASKGRGMPKYKPAFTCGFRGFPNKLQPIGTHAAPTIDQVRRIERRYKVKIWVKEGLMYYRGTSKLFDKKLHAA